MITIKGTEFQINDIPLEVMNISKLGFIWQAIMGYVVYLPVL